MNNFSFEHDGQKLWYSRSLACGLITFAYNNAGKLCVLANKRGPGAEFNKGLWNVPGGFIDFNEDARQCALRETFEETGIDILNFNVKQLKFLDLDTTPHGVRQTMTVRYVAELHQTAEEIEPYFSTANSEPDEVAEIKFIPVDELENYNWTRGQIHYILMAKSEIEIPF